MSLKSHAKLITTQYSQFMTCTTHSYSFISTFITILKIKQAFSIQSQENNHTLRCLAQHLAQAEGSRSGETFSPRRAPFA